MKKLRHSRVFLLLIIVLYVVSQEALTQTVTRIISPDGKEFTRVVGKDNLGNLYAIDNSTDVISRITHDGMISTYLDLNGFGSITSVNLAFDPNQNPHVIGIYPRITYRFKAPEIGRPVSMGTRSVILDDSWDGKPNTLGNSRSIAVDFMGNAFVVTGGSRVLKISPAGIETEYLNVDGSFNGNQFISTGASPVIDSKNNVFVSGANGALFKLHKNGDREQILSRYLDNEGIYFKSGNPHIAIDSADNVFITGSSTNNVVKVSPNGELSTLISIFGDDKGRSLKTPTLITTDLDDNVYVLGKSSHNIFKVSPFGDVKEIYYDFGSGNGYSIADADGMHTDSKGNLYLGGFGNFELVKFTSAAPTIYNGGSLILPIVEVSGRFYQVELKLAYANIYFTLGDVEEIAQPASNFGVSTFSNNTLHIPMVTVGTKKYLLEIYFYGDIFQISRVDEYLSN